jgi:hypothetical protein
MQYSQAQFAEIILRSREKDMEIPSDAINFSLGALCERGKSISINIHSVAKRKVHQN